MRALAALAAAALLAGCSSSPTSVLGVAAAPADSVRWERAEGTPWVTALTWHSGVMNLWLEHSALAGGFSSVCRVEAGVVHRAALPPAWVIGDTIRGVPVAFTPGSDSVSIATIWLVCTNDTMRGEARAVFPTSCGPAEERLPLTLVRVP